MTADEIKVLRLPVVTGAVLTVIALFGALATSSQAILLDCFFSAIYLATGLFTLRVGKLLQIGGSPRFPFGYAPFEPTVNLIKSLLIAGVSIFAVWQGVAGVIRGGEVISFGGALIYSAISGVITISMAAYVWSKHRHMKSPLVRGDLVARFIDAVTALGVLLSFGLAYALNSMGYTAYAKYVDPVLTLVMVAATIGMPFGLAKRSLLELLSMAPPDAVLEPYKKSIKRILRDVPLAALEVRAVKIGRTLEIMSYAQLKEDANLDVATQDRLRVAIKDEISSPEETIDSILIFSYLPVESLH